MEIGNLVWPGRFFKTMATATLGGLLSGLPQPSSAQVRTWTAADGRQLQAEIVSYHGADVVLKTKRGNFAIPFADFSRTDQAWVRTWKAVQEQPQMTPEGTSPLLPPSKRYQRSPGNFEDLELGKWPTFVAVDRDKLQIETVSENWNAKQYIYRSPHFEFHSPVRLSAGVVREFSRLFEATFEMMKAMPIGLDPQPSGEGFHLTKLYATEEDYFAAGGVRGSAGMFAFGGQPGSSFSNVIHVPLTSLGVENVGSRIVVDKKKGSNTLIHEITHQLTGRWLPVLPTWFVEGIAETVSAQKYDHGRFNLTTMDRAVQDDVSRYARDGRDFPMVNLTELMSISNHQWKAALAASEGRSTHYPSANLLFYYFLRLEGKGDGEALVNYLKAIRSGQREADARDKFLLKGGTYADLEKDVELKWRIKGLHLAFH